MFKYKVTELTFSGGETINLGDADVVVLVGANNCGKTKTMQEIGGRLKDWDRKWVSVKGLNKELKGSPDDIVSWLRSLYPMSSGERIGIVETDSIDYLFAESSLHKMKTIHVKAALVSTLNAGDRLSISRKVEMVDIFRTLAQHPIHHLQRNHNLSKQVSKILKDELNIHLVIPMKMHGDVQLLTSDTEDISTSDDWFTDDYHNWLSELSSLENEGHGIQAFTGCLIKIVINDSKILLIDEPELFLHPPQAKRLGRFIAESANANDQQIIMATHSAEIIQGVLEGTNKTAIIRINRDGNENHAFPLHGEDIKDLWQKPILRSSGAIRGLFHEGVIVCEGDSDIRFYESLMQRLDKTIFENPADFYFVHGGGKGQLATLATSYRSLHIPTVAIADFDIFRRKGELINTIEALGGDFSELEKLYNSVSSSLTRAGSIRSKGEVLDEIGVLINELRDEAKITGQHKEALNKLLSDGRDWSRAKELGFNALRGGKYQECLELLGKLRAIGLFIVPTGALETWGDNSMSPDKKQWILEALGIIDSDINSFSEATAFMEQIANYLWNK